MTEWWLGLPDAETRIACGRDTHTLRWRAGDLHAVDHEDIDGERALAALGGERCTCVEVLDAWARHTDDLRVLMLARRSDADQLAVAIDWLGPRHRGRRHGIRGGWMAYPPGGPGIGGWEDAEDELVPLLALGGGLPDRLVASVAAAWTRARDRPVVNGASTGAQLIAALYGRVLAVLRTWLGEPGLDIKLQSTDDINPSISRLDDGRVRAALPFAWLSEVWCRGLATIAGRLTLSVAFEDGGDRWTLETVAPDLVTTERLTIIVGR